MRIWEYIKDKAGILIGYLLFIAIMLIAFRAMRTPGELTVIFLVLTVLLLVTVILTDYIKRTYGAVGSEISGHGYVRGAGFL